jgi:hypothetical protein
MDLLPPSGVRPTLLDALALIVRRQGYETLVRAPILEQTSHYFPDPWEPSERGVRVLCLRLLAYAGLDDLDASVEIDADAYLPTEERVGSFRHEGAAAWFWDIRDDVCVFGAERRQLDEADAIVGTMCHEVAHAYRRFHDLESTTRQIDEEQTDITTIYLGFGILTVNNAQRYRTSGDARMMRWSMTHTGYLSPQAMAYLFAAQCVARGLPAAEMSRLGRLLEANQRECFEEARRELSEDVDGLRLRLGIPPVEMWPPEEPFELPELREDAMFEPIDAGVLRRAEFAERNAGRSVWRIATTSSGWLGVVGALAGSIGAGVAASRLEWSVSGAAFSAAAFGSVAGALLGRRLVHYTCSDRDCAASIPSGVTDRCPGCGCRLVGTLDDERDRLEAEEVLAARRSVDDLRRSLAERRVKGTRRSLTVLTTIGIVAAGLAVIDSLPRTATIWAVTRDDAEMWNTKVVVTGYVIESRAGTTSLIDEKGKEFVPFRLGDETAKMVVWYEPGMVSPALRDGDHVRCTGEQFYVDTDGKKKLRFIASGVTRVK